MSKHDHAKHQPAGHAHEQHGKPASDGLHKDWRTWVVVVLMLIGMAVYIGTLDDSTVPGKQERPRDPAMAE